MATTLTRTRHNATLYVELSYSHYPSPISVVQVSTNIAFIHRAFLTTGEYVLNFT